ncbi:GNAT family N-acetyltransferase [Hyalangium gracile]|uniref:GNAT family N-acetyltransferase n=1 Tax=Hyalangium gracile TaxID=394092 RepID=UPI001CCF0788|nr:GNAT family N-acetyltransferase [Hyalangium gracile]
MAFQIRHAVSTDAALLPDIEHSAGELFRTLPDLAWIADTGVMSAEVHLGRIAQGTVWVAQLEEGPLVGFLNAERVGDELHIWEFAVHSSHQGRGVGRRFMETVEAYARREGISALTLTTFRGVPWNEPFYARLGFETLEGDAIGERLSAVLRDEALKGLPAERRCAMRRLLSPGG